MRRGVSGGQKKRVSHPTDQSCPETGKLIRQLQLCHVAWAAWVGRLRRHPHLLQPGSVRHDSCVTSPASSQHCPATLHVAADGLQSPSNVTEQSACYPGDDWGADGGPQARGVRGRDFSTGLDSSTTYQIIKWMRDTCHTQLDTMLVALLQPCALASLSLELCIKTCSPCRTVADQPWAWTAACTYRRHRSGCADTCHTHAGHHAGTALLQPCALAFHEPCFSSTGLRMSPVA